MRIRTAERSTYPDLHIVCGEIERDPDDDHAVVNPTVIVEVLSDSTEDSDRTEKFAAYRRLKSLREYVLVSQRERRLEVYRRDGRRWYLDWLCIIASSHHRVIVTKPATKIAGERARFAEPGRSERAIAARAPDACVRSGAPSGSAPSMHRELTARPALQPATSARKTSVSDPRVTELT